MTRSFYPDNFLLDEVVVEFAEVVLVVVLFADGLSVEVDSAEESEEVVGSAVEEELEAVSTMYINGFSFLDIT